ncbi:MAG: type 4a pilus biogenesis protein PilO [Patescibacteria group bacterium]|nr:type 4a pilus biogenesis protein PilO [Patescibacteria group bacterium]
MQFNIKTIYKNSNLIIIVVILVAIGAGFYFLKPQYDAWRNIGTQIKGEETSLANSKKALEDTKKLVKDYEGVKEQVRTLSLALPSEKDIPNLLVQLEALAIKNGILMEEVSYSEEIKKGSENPIEPPATDAADLGQNKTQDNNTASNLPAMVPLVSPAPSEGYATLKVSLSLTGRYDVFMRYLEDVQKNLRFLDVVSVDFDTKGGDSQSSKSGEGEVGGVKFEDRVLTFKIELRTYYLK